MDEQIISDKETLDMLKIIKMEHTSFACYTGESPPKYKITNWHEIKEFLWDRYKMSICWENKASAHFGWLFRHGQCECELSGYDSKLESPIEAEINGIKKAIEYVHSNLLKV